MNTPDPDAPLTEEEQWAHQQQGAYLRVMRERLGEDGLTRAIHEGLTEATQDSAPPPQAEAP